MSERGGQGKSALGRHTRQPLTHASEITVRAAGGSLIVTCFTTGAVLRCLNRHSVGVCAYSQSWGAGNTVCKGVAKANLATPLG